MQKDCSVCVRDGRVDYFSVQVGVDEGNACLGLDFYAF